MTFFEYISVMVSVLLALGIARMLGGLGAPLVHRRAKSTYRVHTLWIVHAVLQGVAAAFLLFGQVVSLANRFTAGAFTPS
ncbi:MAG: hypothetical protein R3195_18850 [Gemmatimonadota bacterium]|nr:hypothetical protein [Gemmatimonadota bacterium]